MGVKGYKGFGPGLVCEGDGEYGHYRKEYAENTVFEEPEAKVCKSGMHFCVPPLDVFGYYPPVLKNGELAEYAEVEALEDASTDDDSKYTTTKLRVGAKISIAKLAEAHVEWVKTQVASAPSTNTGDGSVATNTGNRSAAEVKGAESVAIVTGKGCKARGAMGCWIVATERDDSGHILCVKTACVDGNAIKPDVWYVLKDREFKEA